MSFSEIMLTGLTVSTIGRVGGVLSGRILDGRLREKGYYPAYTLYSQSDKFCHQVVLFLSVYTRIIDHRLD